MYYVFPSPLILAISGKHSERYLQSRLSNDVRILPAGRACSAAALSPQGRTEGFYTVLRTRPLEFTTWCDGGEHEKLLSAFKRYIVADQISVADQSQTHALIHVGEPSALQALGMEATATALSQIDFQEGLALTRRRLGDIGADLIVPRAKVPTIVGRLKDAGLDELRFDEYTYYRIEAGTPSYPEELNETGLFAESGLSDAVSFKKGCYVGQEVIEKIDAYGRLPRVLKRCRIDGLVDLPAESEFALTESGKKGSVISSAQNTRKGDTLAFVRVPSEVEVGTRVTVSDCNAEIF